MSDAYRKVKAGRLAFKGGELAVVKSINKKKHKKKKHKESEDAIDSVNGEVGSGAVEADNAAVTIGSEVYTIDAAKRMKYEELFPVESKKFGYDPANKSRNGSRTVEESLDDRVRRKADRYCK